MPPSLTNRNNLPHSHPIIEKHKNRNEEDRPNRFDTRLPEKARLEAERTEHDTPERLALQKRLAENRFHATFPQTALFSIPRPPRTNRLFRHSCH